MEFNAIDGMIGVKGEMQLLTEMHPSGFTIEDMTHFESSLQHFGKSLNDYQISIDGELQHNNVAVDLDSAIELMKTGSVEEGLEKLGVIKADLSNEMITAIDKLSGYDKHYDDIQFANKLMSDDVTLTRELGRVRNAEDLEVALDKKGTSMKEVIDILKKKTKLGRWTKTLAIVTVATITSAELYTLIKRHQEAMNGCWLLNIKSGDKCKVTTMSKCSTAPVVRCSSTEFIRNYCVKPRGRGCAARLNDCVNDDKPCSKYCELVKPPAGFRLKCVHVGFWGAFEDAVHTTLQSGMNWTRWIVIAAVSLGAFLLIWTIIQK